MMFDHAIGYMVLVVCAVVALIGASHVVKRSRCHPLADHRPVRLRPARPVGLDGGRILGVVLFTVAVVYAVCVALAFAAYSVGLLSWT